MSTAPAQQSPRVDDPSDLDPGVLFSKICWCNRDVLFAEHERPPTDGLSPREARQAWFNHFAGIWNDRWDDTQRDRWSLRYADFCRDHEEDLARARTPISGSNTPTNPTFPEGVGMGSDGDALADRMFETLASGRGSSVLSVHDLEDTDVIFSLTAPPPPPQEEEPSVPWNPNGPNEDLLSPAGHRPRRQRRTSTPLSPRLRSQARSRSASPHNGNLAHPSLPPISTLFASIPRPDQEHTSNYTLSPMSGRDEDEPAAKRARWSLDGSRSPTPPQSGAAVFSAHDVVARPPSPILHGAFSHLPRLTLPLPRRKESASDRGFDPGFATSAARWSSTPRSELAYGPAGSTPGDFAPDSEHAAGPSGAEGRGKRKRTSPMERGCS